MPDEEPDLPEPMSQDAREGLQLGREIAARYSGDVSEWAARIAFGKQTESLQHCVQALFILQNQIKAFPDPTPTGPWRPADGAASKIDGGDDGA